MGASKIRSWTLVLAATVAFSSNSAAQSGEDPDEPNEDQEARSAWFMSMRNGSDGTIPQNALMQARLQAEQMPSPLSKGAAIMDAGIWNWAWLGPGNIGGRIRTILIHPTRPDTMWIGGVSGGIWKTLNSGASWQPLNDFLPSLAVTSLAMDPTNPDVIYAATGEGFAGSSSGWPGSGVFKSTNGGSSWTQLTDTQNWKWTNRISHHPTQSGVLLAAVTGAGGDYLYRTNNGGLTWATQVGTQQDWVDVKFNPNDGNEVLAAISVGLVYRSTDAGLTFSQLNCGTNGLCIYGRPEVGFGPGGYRYVSANMNSGEVWRSTNSGVNWSQRSTGVNYMGIASVGQYANMLWVDPTNGEHILVGGIDIYRSTNGGSTFKRISKWDAYHTGQSAHGDNHFAVQHPRYNGGTNKTIFFGNDGGIQKAVNISTVDTTSGWTNLSNGLGITQFYGGAAAPNGSFYIGGTQDNSHITVAGGAGTSAWIQKFTGDGGFALIDPTNTNVQYGENQYLNVFKTTDGGVSYQRARKGLADTTNASAPFVAPLAMDPNNPLVILAGSTRIWKTVDGAANWTLLRPALSNTPAVTAVAIAPGNSNLIWVGYFDGRLYKSIDGGSIWSYEGLSTPHNRAVTDIAIDPSDIDNVWITFGGYETSNVWYTDAGTTPGGVPGTHWFDRSGSAPYSLPAVHVSTVNVHPGNSDWVYVGTDVGVFSSDNRGVSWSRDPHFPAVGNDGPAYTQVSDLFWQGDFLIAATHGRGMYRVRPGLVVYVDFAAAGGGDGSFLAPFNNIPAATSAIGNGSIMNLRGGVYASPVVIDKAVQVTTSNGAVIIE